MLSQYKKISLDICSCTFLMVKLKIHWLEKTHLLGQYHFRIYYKTLKIEMSFRLTTYTEIFRQFSQFL